jgi:hypothetical protein
MNDDDRRLAEKMQDLGRNAKEMAELANSADPNDPRELFRIARVFHECEMTGRAALNHQGKLLCSARRIFDANHPQGEADKLYGRWRKEKLGISSSQAHRLVTYHKFVEKHGLSASPEGATLPSVKAVAAIESWFDTKDGKKEIVADIKKGVVVTEKDVKRRLGSPYAREEPAPDPAPAKPQKPRKPHTVVFEAVQTLSALKTTGGLVSKKLTDRQREIMRQRIQMVRGLLEDVERHL